LKNAKEAVGSTSWKNAMRVHEGTLEYGTTYCDIIEVDVEEDTNKSIFDNE